MDFTVEISVSNCELAICLRTSCRIYLSSSKTQSFRNCKCVNRLWAHSAMIRINDLLRIQRSQLQSIRDSTRYHSCDAGSPVVGSVRKQDQRLRRPDSQAIQLQYYPTVSGGYEIFYTNPTDCDCNPNSTLDGNPLAAFNCSFPNLKTV